MRRFIAFQLLYLALNHSSAFVASRVVPEFSSDLARNAYEYLENVCEPGGFPNPRTLCTEGYKRAVDYIAKEMEAIGLQPLGDKTATTYIQTIRNSNHTKWCPPGIQNVIGMVPGSVFPDKYVVVFSTLSGNYNLNPQTYKTRGNDGFSFVFDSGMFVAASLAMAREMMKHPPLRSTIFLFAGTGQAEGWEVVGEREKGKKYGPYESFVNTPWFQGMCDGLASLSNECQSIWEKGLTYWIKNPTVDLSNIEIMFHADRLGSPYGFKENAMLMIGGEQTRYGTQNLTLNNFIDEVWPEDSTVRLMKAPLAAIDGAGLGYNCRSNYFIEPCGTSCKGLKLVWFAQMGFQMMSDRIDFVRELYSGLRRRYQNISLWSNNTFDPTAKAFFTIDNLDNTYWPHFEPTVIALYDVIFNTANKSETFVMDFDESVKWNINENEYENVVKNLEVMSRLGENLPSSLGFLYTNEYPNSIRNFAIQVMDGIRNGTIDLTDESLQEILRKTAQEAAGVFMSMDYFNANYPNSEAYSDQRIGDVQTLPEQINQTQEPSSSPTQSPESGLESANAIPTWIWALIIVTTVFCIIAAWGFCLVRRSRVYNNPGTNFADTPPDEEVARGPGFDEATVLGYEHLSNSSVRSFEIPIAVRADSNSIAQSHVSSISVIPLPLPEETEESFIDVQLNNPCSVTRDGANCEKIQTQRSTMSQGPIFPVDCEFKDQVRSQPHPHEPDERPFQRLSIESGVQLQHETTEAESYESRIASNVNGNVRAMSDAFVGEQSRDQNDSVSGDLHSQKADFLVAEEQIDAMHALDESSDSDSEFFENRLRFYSI